MIAQGELACGHCDDCRLRLKGFADAVIKDPIRYVEKREGSGF
jgi:7-cyano-7-deazaguanine synthase